MSKQERINIALTTDTKELIELAKAKKFVKDRKKMSMDEFLKETFLREIESEKK